MLFMRAYELMVIFDADVDDAAIQGHLKGLIADTVEADDGSVAKVDNWGKRRFAYQINHKWEGFYVVLEFLSPGALQEIDRTLRLTDEVVRHKFIRLPLNEAHKRGLAAATL